MDRRTDYSRIAATYDRRYEENQYPGTERTLFEFIGSAPGLRVLEVGCGTGHWLGRLDWLGGGRAGLDASPEMLAKARACLPDAELLEGRAESLPWPDETFDRVYCINAFHHFADKQAFLLEARRVLRPFGALMTIGLDPHQGDDRWFIYEYFEGSLETDRRRYPPAATIRGWMNQAGFDACETRVAEHLQLRVAASEALEKRQLDKSVTSQLSVLTDSEYRRGIERIEADILAGKETGLELVLSLDLRLYATIGRVGIAAEHAR